jgi:hypothetical protein
LLGFPGGLCTKICSGLPEALPCGLNETCHMFLGVGMCFKDCVSSMCPNRTNAMCLELNPAWTQPACIPQ